MPSVIITQNPTALVCRTCYGSGWARVSKSSGTFPLRPKTKHRDLFYYRELLIFEVEATKQDNAALHLQSSAEI